MTDIAVRDAVDKALTDLPKSNLIDREVVQDLLLDIRRVSWTSIQEDDDDPCPN